MATNLSKANNLQKAKRWIRMSCGGIGGIDCDCFRNRQNGAKVTRCPAGLGSGALCRRARLCERCWKRTHPPCQSSATYSSESRICSTRQSNGSNSSTLHQKGCLHEWLLRNLFIRTMEWSLFGWGVAVVVESAGVDISKPPPVLSLLLCVLDVLTFLSREEMDPSEVRKSPPSGLCQCFHSYFLQSVALKCQWTRGRA